MKINNTELNESDMKQMLEYLAGTLAEAEKQHPEFTDDTQLQLPCKDGHVTYYPISLGGLKSLVQYVIESIPTRRRIDEKHHIEFNRIIKTTNDTPIPDGEPRMLFRGRDNLAIPLLRFYRTLCYNAGCNDFQLQSIDVMIKEFEDFAANSPTMKQPGITRGK